MYPFESTSVRCWAPLLVWIAVIFVFSTDTFSGAQSSRFLVPILAFFFPAITDEQIATVNGVVRKSGHVGEYFVLGLLALRAIRVRQSSLVRAKLLAGLLILAVALSDEFHQSLTKSRTGSILDVGYDCFGGFAALFMLPRPRHETRALHPRSVL